MSLVTMGAVNASASVFQLPDASLVSLGEFLILEGAGGTSELVIVRSIGAGRASSGAVTVARGAGGTVAVAHTAPVTLSAYDPSPSGVGGSISATDGTTTVNPATSIQFPAGTLTNLGAGVAGVGLLLSRIGPFPMVFNDPDIINGIELTDLDVGTLVIIAWPETATAFNGGNDYIVTAVGTQDDNTNLGRFDGDTAGTAPVAVFSARVVGVSPNPPTPVRSARVTATPCRLIAFLEADGAPSQGSTNIYAIVASPAS